MNITYGDGRTEFGPGVSIKITGNDFSLAIQAWIVAQGVHINGPITITVNNEMCS